MLGTYGCWLESTEPGYRLALGVAVRHHRIPTLEPLLMEKPVPGLAAELNHRQLSLLRGYKDSEFFDVRSYCKLFNVSQITASRDLTTLHKLCLVRRIGKRRSNRYYRQAEAEG